MRLTSLACLLLAGVLPFCAPAAAQKSEVPSVIGNVLSLQDTESAFFSPDGRMLAVTGYGNGVTLWDLSSGLPLRTLTARPYLTGAAFTHDGKRLLTAHKDGALRLWDTETGVVLDALRTKPRSGDPDPSPLIGLFIDRNGEHAIATGYGPTAALWNIPARKHLFTLPRTDKDKLEKTQSISAARISADGTRLIVIASKSYGKLDAAAIFDARTGDELSFFDLPEDHVVVDNGLVGDDQAIVLASGGNCPRGELMLFSLTERRVVAPVFRPANCDNPKDGEELNAPKVHASPDSARVVISQNGNPDLHIFDTATRKMERTLRLPDAAHPRVLGVSRDLKVAAIGDGDRIAIRALDSGATVKTLRGFAVPADRIAIAANGDDIVVQQERGTGSGAPVVVGIRKPGDVQGAVFRVPVPADARLDDVAAEPRLALGSGDKPEILLFALDGKTAPRSIPIAPLKKAVLARLSPDGKTAVVQGHTKDNEEDEAVFVVDLADGKMRQIKIGNPETFVTAIVFTGDGKRFAVGLRDGSAEVFETDAARSVKKLPPYSEDGDTAAIAFSPDGTLLAGGAMFDDRVFVWTIASGKVMRSITLPDSLAGYRIVTAVALSNDRKTLAVGLGHRAVSSGDIGPEVGGILIFDLGSGKLRATLRGHVGPITALAFSKDDRALISGAYDGTVRSWDRATGKPLATAAMDADGRWFVMTDAGFFAAPDGVDNLVSLVRGANAVSGDAVRKALARPDLVEALLKGDPKGQYRAAAKALNLSAIAAPAR